MASINCLRSDFRRSARILLRTAAANGIFVQVTSTCRSRTKQARLYRAYVAGRSRYPAAPPGRSQHERGLALDLKGDEDELRALGAWWRSVGGTWGGEEDPIHFAAPRSW